MGLADRWPEQPGRLASNHGLAHPVRTTYTLNATHTRQQTSSSSSMGSCRAAPSPLTTRLTFMRLVALGSSEAAAAAAPPASGCGGGAPAPSSSLSAISRPSDPASEIVAYLNNRVVIIRRPGREGKGREERRSATRVRGGPLGRKVPGVRHHRSLTALIQASASPHPPCSTSCRTWSSRARGSAVSDSRWWCRRS